MKKIEEDKGRVEMKLGERINFLRIKNHWSQAELACKAGLTRSHISHIENNQITNPGAAAIVNLARAFEIPQTTLLVDEPPELRPFVSKSDADAGANVETCQFNAFYDPELSRLLTPEIVNSLNPDTSRAIFAIIHDAMKQKDKEKKNACAKIQPLTVQEPTNNKQDDYP